MGGEIQVQSELGQGACFSFTLNLLVPAKTADDAADVGAPEGKIGAPYFAGAAESVVVAARAELNESERSLAWSAVAELMDLLAQSNGEAPDYFLKHQTRLAQVLDVIQLHELKQALNTYELDQAWALLQQLSSAALSR